MSQRYPSVDAYLRRAPAFAQPIIEHLREVVHAGCPEVEECIKWNCPFFVYRGPVCAVAAFKARCRIVSGRPTSSARVPPPRKQINLRREAPPCTGEAWTPGPVPRARRDHLPSGALVSSAAWMRHHGAPASAFCSMTFRPLKRRSVRTIS